MPTRSISARTLTAEINVHDDTEHGRFLVIASVVGHGHRTAFIYRRQLSCVSRSLFLHSLFDSQ